jgi:hypothetical protein
MRPPGEVREQEFQNLLGETVRFGLDRQYRAVSGTLLPQRARKLLHIDVLVFHASVPVPGVKNTRHQARVLTFPAG